MTVDLLDVPRSFVGVGGWASGRSSSSDRSSRVVNERKRIIRERTDHRDAITGVLMDGDTQFLLCSLNRRLINKDCWGFSRILGVVHFPAFAGGSGREKRTRCGRVRIDYLLLRRGFSWGR